ncbi:hypothetical protein PR048_005447 [Dryococelus australis]|uniref:DUF4371 domain-containing protein n=1 Tax=Dryococelus australis TaxID=614101 RepID=A0ABQ9I963_9NEOP|nr:hypothetical protein PR048_005447 [Dryococelus australis]
MQQQITVSERLMIYIRTLKYLVRQGLVIRGHAKDEGNFMELLKERSEDKPILKAWLKHEQGKPTFTHSDVQNEIIQIMGHEVLTTVLKNIKHCLRGQVYEGAGNMKDCNKGAQTIIIDNQPLAEHVHCVAHCCNLVIKKCCDASSASKPIFTHISEETAGAPVENISNIKPLYPTRWLYRKVQIEEIEKEYDIILKTHHELSEDDYGGASGLLHCFSNGSTYLGFVIAKDVIDLDEFNKSFEGRRKILSLWPNQMVYVIYEEKINSKLFLIFCCEKSDETNLQLLALPRIVKPPKRFCEPGEQKEWHSCEEFY